MSSRGFFFILFVLSPVVVTGRGGGRSGGGHSSHGGYGHSSHGYGSGSHTYPSGPNLSGNNHPSHTYPNSKTGLSGNSGPHINHKTEVHHHYHYSPPQQVHYGTGYHPAYHGPPPVYVYTYHDSGSRYSSLLTGLALYNLGRMSGHHDSNYYSHAQSYRGPTGERCEFQIIKSNGEFEKTKMDCQLMSSFILDDERHREQERNRVVSTNTNIITTVTKVENKSDSSEVVTTSVQNTTVVKDSLETKGPSIQVTPGMECYMVRTYRDSTIRKKVECGLLQEYARSHFSASSRNVPLQNVFILMCLVYFVIW